MLNHRRFGALVLALGLGLLTAVPARAADVDKLLPNDTETVVTINVKQILDSALVKKIGLEMVKQALKDNNDATKILDDLGFDPFKDLETVIVAGPGGQDADKGLIIVKGKFDEKKFKEKAKQAAKEHKDVVKVIEVPDGLGGKYEMYEVMPEGVQQTLTVCIADSKTILAAPSKDYVVRALDQQAGRAKVALKSKEMAALLGRVDAKQSLWIAVVASALEKTQLKDNDQAKEIIEKLADATAGITIDKDIKLELGVTGKDAKAAKDLDNTISDGIQQAQGLALIFLAKEKQFKPLLDIVKTIKTNLKDKTITIKTEIGGDIIENLIPKDN